MTNLLIKGNSKLGKNIATFSLPAGKENGTCSVTCKGCYALKGTYLYPSVKGGLQERYEFSKDSEKFKEKLNKELSSKSHEGTEYVRIHASGDFYSQEYINTWDEVVKQHPNKLFYAYTKQLGFDYSKIKENPNFVLINSLHHGLNFGTKEYIDALGAKTGAIICPVNKETRNSIHCGTECTLCMTKEAQEKGVLFYQH